MSLAIELLSKSKTKFFEGTVKIQSDQRVSVHITITVQSSGAQRHFDHPVQECINISILFWQQVSVVLDHLQASIQRYEVRSMHITHCEIPYYLQGVHRNRLIL